MSETPVLTKKQQKSSLSAKKTKTKQVIKNVLASPYMKYWPVVSNGHHKTLKHTLNQCLPNVLPQQVKIPWKELKGITKSERKKIRDRYFLEQLGSDFNRENTVKREGLILGINDVTKALEKQNAKCVLIAEDVQPRLMVEHVIDQAVLLGTPVLIVPELRTILKAKCGISGAAVAFTEGPTYKLVQNVLEDISKEYLIPSNHINYDRALKAGNDSVVIIEDEDSIIEDISKTNLIDMNIEDKVMEETKMKTPEKSFSNESSKNIYLNRKTKGKRVFVPDKSPRQVNKDRMNFDSTGFLSFSVDSTDVQNNVGKKYKSLKVKRIKGDTNRNKRKIEAMKQKKVYTKAAKKNRR